MQRKCKESNKQAEYNVTVKDNRTGKILTDVDCACAFVITHLGKDGGDVYSSFVNVLDTKDITRVCMTALDEIRRLCRRYPNLAIHLTAECLSNDMPYPWYKHNKRAEIIIEGDELK